MRVLQGRDVFNRTTNPRCDCTVRLDVDDVHAYAPLYSWFGNS